MTDTPRLIEVAFPLKQASLDSVHEKNVRHGHISTLHIWPARRPLAACRAALIATLLPDPGTPEERRKLCEKIGGKVVSKVEKKVMPNGKTVERIKEETEGGILHWKRETDNADDLQWFRDEIRKAYGGRAPKVLDPFAGGGAIPLEAMRLGCEATAIDINPVAWFILKCTLEYPQKLAGQKRPLPEFILRNREFMEGFFKAQGIKGAALRKQLEKLGFTGTNGRPAGGQDQKTLTGLHFDDHSLEADLEADLAWHVRAWGQWVLDRARRDLARFYPTYADFEPLKKSDRPFEACPRQLVSVREDGTSDIDTLNAEFTADYLDDPRNARWVAKPTVAYLWARTVKCKNCRATVPLLKTRWLCKKDRGRVLLAIEPDGNATAVRFGVNTNVPTRGANPAQRREHDRSIGGGTTSRSGVKCPLCSTITPTEDIQLTGQAQELGELMYVAVCDTSDGRTFRSITEDDLNCWEACAEALKSAIADEPCGPLTERIDPRRPSPNSRGLAGLTKYGIDCFGKVFNARQQLALLTFARLNRRLPEVLQTARYSSDWSAAVADSLALPIDKLADYNSKGCTWNLSRQGIGHTFTRFALPMTTDYAESNPVSDVSGGFGGGVAFTASCIDSLLEAAVGLPVVSRGSALDNRTEQFDLLVTDPPYYDSIPYSDISDFFFVWLRRAVGNRYPQQFDTSLVPRDGEIIQHAGRLDGDNDRARKVYEDGMYESFVAAQRQLAPNGRFVIVFAHKQPDAWETLVAAIIRSGFTVVASWPIQTERETRFIALGGAGLASSVWLVCRKRPDTARPGWDNKVLEEMRANIAKRLRGFWDAGIRGPDFVWAATGPALEAYSKHPVVKKADEPGQVMSVTEFLHHVRRIVVDFVVGRVLSGDGEENMAAADRLDDVTAYYLLHRHDFGFTDAPVGGCILYAISCGLSDSELADTWDVLSRSGGSADDEEEEEDTDPDAEADPEAEVGSGSKVKLKTWAQRNRKNMGYEAAGGRPVPLIDRLHRLMHLWRAGESAKVDEYLDDYGLRRHELFRRLLQSLVELSPAGSDERATLESISNHIGAKGAKPSETMPLPGMEPDEEGEER